MVFESASGDNFAGVCNLRTSALASSATYEDKRRRLVPEAGPSTSTLESTATYELRLWRGRQATGEPHL